MRFASGIIGILGGLAGLVLGLKWFMDISDAGEMASLLPASMKIATYALIGCGIIGLVISVMVIMRKFNKFANAAILIVAGGLPLVFVTDAIFGTPMILAGLLAFAVKYDKA